MNEKELLKSEDCVMCICLQCYREHGLDPELCSYSDCQWCNEERGQWTERCNKYLEIRDIPFM